MNYLTIPEFSWDFIERWYPNYHSCNEIAMSDDLTKIIDGEWVQGDDAHKLLNKIAEEGGWSSNAFCIAEAKRRSAELDLMFYHRAIESYINHQRNLIIDERLVDSVSRDITRHIKTDFIELEVTLSKGLYDRVQNIISRNLKTK